jgi:predicted Zn-dependent protease with MMP-like domain
MDRSDFEKLVSQSVEELPDEFKDRMENVTIAVQDYPDPGQLTRSGVKGNYTLLGLYEGIPLTRRGTGYGMVTPDRITIFQQPIELNCRRRGLDIAAEVTRVVKHEIAHYFGIGDARLQQIENDRRSR